MFKKLIATAVSLVLCLATLCACRSSIRVASGKLTSSANSACPGSKQTLSVISILSPATMWLYAIARPPISPQRNVISCSSGAVSRAPPSVLAGRLA